MKTMIASIHATMISSLLFLVISFLILKTKRETLEHLFFLFARIIILDEVFTMVRINMVKFSDFKYPTTFSLNEIVSLVCTMNVKPVYTNHSG